MVHGSVHGLLRIITTVGMLLLVGVSFAAWKLSDGPITMDFLAPYVADSISIEGEVQFDIAGAVLTWGAFNESPELRVLDVSALDADGRIIAAFPEMIVRLSLLSILEASPAPQEIVLSNPVVRLTRVADGSIQLGLDPEPLKAGTAEEQSVFKDSAIETESAEVLLELVVRALSRPGDASNLPGYLERARIEDAAVVFRDQRSGLEWVVPSGSIELERDPNGVSLLAQLPYVNNDEASELILTGTYDTPESVLSLAIEFEDILPSSFAPLVPSIEEMDGIDVSLSGRMDIDLILTDTRLTVRQATLNIMTGVGVVELSEPIGRAYPLENLRLLAQAGEGFNTVVIESFVATLRDGRNSGPVITMTLDGKDLWASPDVALNIGIDELAIDELKAYWPQDIKPNTRSWITRNLENGVVKDAQFAIEFNGDSLETIDVAEFQGRADLQNFSVTYIRQMPVADNVSGELLLGLSEVSIDIVGGHVIQPDWQDKLNIESGRVRLHGLDTKLHSADIDLRVDGELHDAIALIDKEPLQYASALGISPGATAGQAQVLLGIDFPLIQDLKLDQVQVQAQASVAQTSINDAAFGLDLESGQFSLELNNSGMDVVGTASIGGIRTGLSWRENFSQSDFRRQYAVDAVLENAQRPLVGLGQAIFSPPYVDGPVRVEAIYTVLDNEVAGLNVEADLQNTGITIPQLNWGKGADSNALLTAQMRLSGDRLEAIDEFTVSSVENNLQVSGYASFKPDASLQLLRLDRSMVGQSVFEVDVNAGPDGVLDIVANGDVIDGTTFWSSLRGNDQTRSFEERANNQERVAFRFEGKMDRLLLSPEGELTEVNARIVQESSGLSNIQLTGLVNDGDTFGLNMDPVGENRFFRAESSNGGAVLRALGLGDDFVGGDLMVTGTIRETGAVDGVFNIDSFRIVDAPLLARLLSVAALTGIVDELQGNGISFSELNLPFSFADNVFAIENGAMYGASLGLTAKGRYDIGANTINGDGTLIPAYAVNSAVGSIPILGPILTGGEAGGGVFAATYAMRGNPDGAEITVNPLATLTPGFLRQIFKVFDPAPASSGSSEKTSVVERPN